MPGKGVDALINALPDVRSTFPDVRLVIVGHDSESEYGRSSRDSRKRSTCRTTSPSRAATDVPELMAAADVFAMPSTGEPFGLVFPEAMAIRRPVVALRNGGTAEVVEHGITGLLSEPGDRAVLVENLLTLLRDPTLRSLMGEAGRRRGRGVVRHATHGRRHGRCVRAPGDRALRTLTFPASPSPGSRPLPTRLRQPCSRAATYSPCVNRVGRNLIWLLLSQAATWMIRSS